jgi:hypothetical protein
MLAGADQENSRAVTVSYCQYEVTALEVLDNHQ